MKITRGDLLITNDVLAEIIQEKETVLKTAKGPCDKHYCIIVLDRLTTVKDIITKKLKALDKS